MTHDQLHLRCVAAEEQARTEGRCGIPFEKRIDVAHVVRLENRKCRWRRVIETLQDMIRALRRHERIEYVALTFGFDAR